MTSKSLGVPRRRLPQSAATGIAYGRSPNADPTVLTPYRNRRLIKDKFFPPAARRFFRIFLATPTTTLRWFRRRAVHIVATQLVSLIRFVL
jgi:hypothetical protein